MKRWLACLLAAVLLFAACAGAAEEEKEETKVEIQESMATREGEETTGTLAENLLYLREMLENEDVQSLFRIQDVKDLASEVIWKTGVWLYQNRPVTMKILAELGVGEQDLRCIDKLWDSAERVSDGARAYNESEDGQKLQAELTALKEDPEIQKAVEDFIELSTSDDIFGIVEKIRDVVQEAVKAERMPEGEMTKEAVERQLNRSSFTGNLLMELIGFVEQSPWAKESVPALFRNENLWRVLIHLSQDNGMNKPIEDEINLIMNDPELYDFLRRTAAEAAALVKQLKIDGEQAGETTKEDAVPEETDNTPENETAEEEAAL